MPKLLYIITSADRGGAQHYVLTLAKAFGGTVAAGTEATWLFDEAKKQGIRTIPVKHLKRAISPLHDFLAIYELRKIISAEKPDIVHLNSTKAGILGSLALPSYVTSHMSDVGARALYTAHGFILNEPLSASKRALYAFLERYCAKYRQHTIAVSEADKRAIITAGCGTEESVSVIPNGITPIDFLDRKSARQQLNIADNVFAIGTIANLYKTKGLDILIESLSSVIAHHPNKHISLAIVGDGPERDFLARLVKRHQIEKHVLFFGQIQNANRLLKAFDIFALPSRKEGMPFALLEAMQAGLPIIATRVGGVPEMLGDAGILAESENPIKLAYMISNLVENGSERERFSKLTKEQVKKFSEEEMLVETKTIYERLLS